MLTGNYPQHDINQVFDFISEVLTAGNVDEKAQDELTFINRLFSVLPVEAVEYGMQFLHGNTDLPKSCEEILPLYIRFVNLVEYCETIERMKVIPSHPTPEELQERIRMHQDLGKLEESFCKPLLGFAYNKNMPEGKIDPASLPQEEKKGDSAFREEKEDSGTEEQDSTLHLMNSAAPVFYCREPLKTAAFYEDRLGFKSVHLDDEDMPHIRLSRDNIEIILASLPEGAGAMVPPGYALYIYVSEPMLLQMELNNNGVKILKTLAESDTSMHTNREFVFEDIDGRRICVSQRS